MDKIKAQNVVRKILNESDKKEFDALVEATKDPDTDMNKLIEASEKLTEIFDRNNIQMIAKPSGQGDSKMNLFVLHNGEILE
jgi:hypothetical protein